VSRFPRFSRYCEVFCTRKIGFLLFSLCCLSALRFHFQAIQSAIYILFFLYLTGCLSVFLQRHLQFPCIANHRPHLFDYHFLSFYFLFHYFCFSPHLFCSISLSLFPLLFATLYKAHCSHFS